MTEAELQFLQSSQGRELLERYRDYDEAALFHLLLKSRKKGSLKEDNTQTAFLPAVVSQIRLRRKAKDKFSQADKMWFSSLSLEQSTGEAVSNYIASRFLSQWQVADLASGLGGNALFLADRCKKVIAVDSDASTLRLAEANALAYGLSDKMVFINSTVESVLADSQLLAGIDAVFLDPARDREGSTKTRSILNSRPNLLDIWDRLSSITDNIAVKISPAFDYKELSLLPVEPGVELISQGNVNRVAMLWFGDLKTAKRQATIILDNNKTVSFVSREKDLSDPEAYLKDQPVFVSGVQAFLYEPDKAVSKARLTDELAMQYNLARFHHQVSLLTSEKLVDNALQSDSGLARAWKTIKKGSFSWSKLKDMIKEEEVERANIMVKNYPVLPEEVYRQTKLKEGGNFFLILTTFADNQPYYILAKRL